MVPQPEKTQHIFQDIYRQNAWLVGSGEGSLPQATAPYRAWLQQFLRERNIHKVTDVGCGDWSFSRLIDWSGIQYAGIDVVPEVVAECQRQFGNRHIAFQVADALADPLPDGDVLIVKDVLQHWPNDAIKTWLTKIVGFRYVVITNDAYERTNVDIAWGQHRAVDITAAPFNVAAKLALEYCGVFERQPKAWCKRVYIIER